MSEETNAEPTMRFRKVSMDEANDWERKEWATANEGINLYFVPKLMEYEHLKNWYIPNILQWHTPNVIDGGIMLSVAVHEEEVYSNEDWGWVAQPSNSMEFVLGKDSFIGMMTVYSRASIDRNSDALYHLHINPVTKSVLLDIVSNPEDEQMRLWLIKNDMHGVVYQRKLNPNTFGQRVVLKRFQKDDYNIELDEELHNYTDIEDPAVIEEIKS
ncbi:MAG: hypothetical protein J6U23_06480, partial [Clostridiales bacterium]|nr:hypothetical protein [Clostridiales bacterium]